MALAKTLYIGRFLHSKSLDELETLNAVFVDENGKIVAVEKDASDDGYKATLQKLGWESEVAVHAKENQFFFPGFIGTTINSDLDCT